VPGYEIPEAGAWPGEHVGKLGQMEYNDGGLAVCHICGTGFENLSVHVYSHGTWPDEYGAYFGLKRRQSLLSRCMRERWSERSSAPTFVQALSRARAARGDWRTLMKGRRGPARLQTRIETAAALAALDVLADVVHPFPTHSERYDTLFAELLRQCEG
jgi:hypothetical protein